MNGAQAEGCSPVAQAYAAGTASAARSSPTRSPSRWRSATPPTAPTPSSSPRRRAAASTQSATTRSAPASACWPRRRASSPRPPAASPPRRWPSSPRAATSTPTSASCSSITGEGLKTIDAVRGTFEATRSSPASRPSTRSRRRGGRLMAKVKLPTQLRAAAGGAAEAQVAGATVGEVLEALYAEHGELRERISDSDGTAAVRQRLHPRGGHPLPRRPRDRGRRQRRGDDPAGGRGRRPRPRGSRRTGRGAKSSAPTRSSASAAWRQPISASIASATCTS